MSCADELTEAMVRIVDGDLWAGRVWCRSCAHEWMACAPWGTATFECPECGRMDGKKKFNCAEEAAGRIATALVDVLGIPANESIAVMKNCITQIIPEGDVRRGWWLNAMQSLRMEE